MVGKVNVYITSTDKTPDFQENSTDKYLLIRIMHGLSVPNCSWPEEWAIQKRIITLYDGDIREISDSEPNPSYSYLNYGTLVAHELGHGLGLDDLYPNYYNENYKNIDYKIKSYDSDVDKLDISDMMS